jgi:hypothetical protein
MSLAAGTLRFALLLSVTLVAGCATSPRVTSDADPAADFASYRTFAFWEPLGLDNQGHVSEASQRMISAARREMEARGYVYDEAAPDLRVNIKAFLDQREVVVNTPGPAYRHAGSVQPNGYLTSATWNDRSDARKQTEGTLNIDLVDAARQKLVWQGIAVSPWVNSNSTWLETQIDGSTAEIFAQYPHRAAP